MRRQAWYDWLTSTNRPIFGQTEFKFRTFEELFRPPDEQQAVDECEFAELVDACKTMGIQPPKKF